VPIVKTIQAYVGETVRIVWIKRDYPTGAPQPGVFTEQRYEEDRLAPPVETWNARTKRTEEP